MLTVVEVDNSRGDTLRLPLLDSSGGYVVKEITGLDPVNASLTTSSLAQVDGADPQNARRDSRNITMKLGLEPDYVTNDVFSLRSNLYDFLSSKAIVSMSFYLDDVLYVMTDGQVESCQNAMFSADPEVDVSIICYDPDFHAPAPVSVDIGTVSTTDVTTITYPGSSDAGVIFTLNIDRDLDGFTLYNTTPDNTVQTFEVNGTGAFADGDVVTITTIPGSKSIILTRAGISTSILYYVDKSSTWISLQKGDNDFRAFASGDEIDGTLVYTPLYGAI